MGKFFSDKGTSSQQSSGDAISNAAWGISKPLYQQAVTGSGTALTNILNTPAYTGQRVAGLNPYQTGSADTLGNFGQNTGNLGYASLAAGLPNVLASGNAGANAQNLFQQYSGDPTQQILGTASSYANNPYVGGMIDAATRDVNRNLFEQQLPGINRSASGSGNINSSRAGVESAIATRGAADRMTDLASTIRGDLFKTGLSQGQSQYNQNLQNQLNANTQLLQGGQFGLNAMAGGQDFANTAFGQGQTAGGLYQTQNQAELDANKAQFDESQANTLNALKTISGVAGVGSTFDGGASSKSGTETYRPSTASTLGGIAKSFFSDPRMKENIKYVGKSQGGHNIYDYEYKPEFKDIAGHGTFRGVMADEVEAVLPKAISVAANGYKIVDYSMVN
jgi:hypothetical protein